MFRDILTDLGGVGVYGVLATLLFIAVFIAMVIWVLRLKKPYVDTMKHMPLEPDKPSPEHGDKNHG